MTYFRNYPHAFSHCLKRIDHLHLAHLSARPAGRFENLSDTSGHPFRGLHETVQCRTQAVRRGAIRRHVAEVTKLIRLAFAALSLLSLALHIDIFHITVITAAGIVISATATATTAITRRWSTSASATTAAAAARTRSPLSPSTNGLSETHFGIAFVIQLLSEQVY